MPFSPVGNINAYGTSLHLDRLSVGYGGRAVASDIDISLRSGSFTCLLGSNGAGKSTLLKTIAGFLKPISGSIVFGKRPLGTLSKKELAMTVGVVLTGRAESLNITVEDMVSFGRSPYTGFFGVPNAADRSIADSCISMIGIEELRRRYLYTLSDGEYQKVMIAKTLAQQTPIILLDEPTAFLDFKSKVEVLELSRELAHSEGKTILMTTHDVNLALKTADSILLMQDGVVKENPDSAEINGFIGIHAAKYL